MADTGLFSGSVDRSQFKNDFLDPDIRNRLIALTHAEVGTQGPQAKQAFMESVVNRAASRGQPLSAAINDPSYFPKITQQRAARGVPGNLAGGYSPLVDAVAGGSNTAKYATGNASGTVGFNGGPQTAAFGGERFGIEGPDKAWAERMGLGTGQPASPVRTVWSANAPQQPTQVADASGSIPPAPTAGPAVANDAGSQPLIPKQGTGMGGLLDGLDNVFASPMFQFGAGMAGAGSKGLGIGGGFAEGAETAGKGYDYAKKKREIEAMAQRDEFVKSLSDPANPLAAALSPESRAAVQGLPPEQGTALLTQLLSRKGDTAQAAAIAKINADAQIAAKNSEYEFARKTDADNAARMMKMFGGEMNAAPSGQQPAASQGAPEAPPVPGARRAADGKYYVPDPNRPGKYLMVQP